jgi:hypothetical protein
MNGRRASRGATAFALVRPHVRGITGPIAVTQAGIAILVVLPTTVLLGFSFPAASALLADRPDETATEAGGLIALNTVDRSRGPSSCRSRSCRWSGRRGPCCCSRP